ncbi:MAG: hypothetical protein Q8N39_10455 [Pelolinea sp.]|nr:hypothetical protein [Pelolinea sp.]
MKKLGFVLILAFILGATGVGSVSAEEFAYGFIPLLAKDYNTGIPREVQSRENFNIILPELVRAMQVGSISDYEPDFYAGVVKVTYLPGLNPANVLRVPFYTNMRDAVIPPASPDSSRGSSAGTPTIYMTLYSSCFDMSNMGANYRVKGSLRTSAGVVVANYDGYADSGGYLWDCFNWGGSDVIPGFIVKFQRFNTSGVWKGTYSASAPRITIKTLNKATGIVTGTGPKLSSFYARWWHPNLDARNTSQFKSINGTVKGTGAWSANIAVTNMRGDDYFGFDVKRTANMRFYYNWWLPALYCRLGDNYCFLESFPNKLVNLSITHAGIKHDFSGKINNYGYFGAFLEDNNQEPIFLAVGDTILGTGVTTYKLPLITAIPNAITDKITGKAPKNSYFEVELGIAGTGWSYWKWAHSDASGNYVADFSGIVDIPDDPVTANVYYKYKTTGNLVYYTYKTGP